MNAVINNELILEADRLMAQRDYPQAIKAWENVRRQRPRDPRGYYRVAEALLALNNSSEAETIIDEGRSKINNVPELYEIWVKCALAQDNWSEALKRAQAYHEAFSDNISAYITLIDCYLLTDNLDLAQCTADKLQTLAPNSVESYKCLAAVFEKADKATDALGTYKLMREQFPASTISYNSAIKYLLNKKQFKEARTLAQEEVAKCPADVDGYANMAEIARLERNRKQEKEILETITSKFPGSEIGYAGLGRMFFEINKLSDAADLLSKALELNPISQESLRLYAEIAMRTKDYGEALRRWEQLRTKYPLEAAGYLRAIAAALQLNKFTFAEDICASGVTILPRSYDLLNAYVDCALRKRDYDTALTRALAMLEKFPGKSSSYRKVRDVYAIMGDYAAAEASTRDGVAKCGATVDLLAAYGRNAMEQQDYPEALERLELFRDHFPWHFAGYAFAADCLFALNRLDEAEEFSQLGMKQAARFPDCWQRYAEAAMRRRDFPEAQRRWGAMRAKFPANPYAYTRAAHACLELGDFAGALELCRQGMERTPNNVDCFVLHVDLAMRQNDRDTAVQRAMTIIENFPHVHIGYTKAAYVCAACLHFDLAAKLANSATIQAPNAIESWLCQADVASRCGKLQEALQLRKAIVQTFPRAIHGYIALAASHMELGQYEEAEKVCEMAMTALPYAADGYIRHAEIAMRQRDFAEARKRWAVVRNKFPRHLSGYTRGAYAFMDDELFGDAEKLSVQAQSIAPNSFETYLLKISIAFRKRDMEAAFVIAQEICEKFPTNPQAWMQMATGHIIEREYNKAEEYIKKVIEIAPYTPLGYISYADIQFRQNNITESVICWEKIRIQFPFDHASYAKLIELYLTLGDLESAEKIYNNVLERFSCINEGINKSFIYVGKMSIFLRYDDPDGALAYAESLYNSYPELAHSRGFITKISECYSQLSKKYIKQKEEFPYNEHLSFLIYILLTNYIGMHEKHFYIVIEMLQRTYGKYIVNKAIVNSIERYNISNIYASFFKYSDVSDIDIPLLELISSGYRYLFKLWAATSETIQNHIRNMVFKIAKDRQYFKFNDEAIYNFIKFIHYFSPKDAWQINYSLDFSNINNGVSTPIGMLSFRKQSRCRLNALSVKHLISKPDKLSIAICISGQLRGYKCLDSLLKSFDFENHSYDIYVHSWQNVGRKYPQYTHAWRVFKNNFFNAYLNVIRGKDAEVLLRTNYPAFDLLLRKSSYTTSEDLEEYYKSNNIILEDDDNDPFCRWMNFDKMYYKIQKCNDMRVSKNHDLVFRTRPDYRILPSKKISLQYIYERSHQDGCVFVPNGYMNIPGCCSDYGITDAFAVGATAYMDIYSNTFNTFHGSSLLNNDYKCTHILWPHAALGFMLYSRGVDVRSLDLKASFNDPEQLSIISIYEAIKQDIALRIPTKDDKLLLEACEKDIESENIKPK